MRLEKLELSGFKSFAKPVSFDFSFPIVAIVGPNGSGKSNLVEAIKWVLGEQSLKELRSKKGPDLIFSGGEGERASSSAKVNLVFKNSPEISDLDFEKLVITRQIWRDGLNQYSINNSPVRLKDISSLLAKISLSGKKHLVVNQGETDRILAISSAERKEVIEDALGLRIYHLKQKEAQQKLDRTKENIDRVKILRQEIAPHLTFLEKQAKKFEKAAKLKEKLNNLYQIFLAKENGYLEARTKKILQRKEPIEEKLEKVKKRTQNLSREFSKKISQEEDRRFQELENKLNNLYQSRLTFERNLGKFEGIIELEKNRETHSEEKSIPKEDLNVFLEELETLLSSILEESVLDRVHELVEEATSYIRSFSERIHSATPSTSSGKVEELTVSKEKLTKGLEKIIEQENKIKMELEKMKEESRAEKSQLKDLEEEILDLKNREVKFREELNLIKIDEERLKIERENYFQEGELAKGYLLGEKLSKDNFADENERKELKKELERLKFRMEESTATDESILKEYQDISSRDKFLESELDDLEKSALNLNKVMGELSQRLEVDFRVGLDKINEKLQELFGLMFEGAKARLYLAKGNKISQKEEDGEAEIKEEEGVEISISLPRKRIKSLQMLSGGERSLVSIAIIFALIETNPPPFLVLDETDAALDEANSLKYGKILQELSKRTQLITITHNRQTMNQAQVLYGVTMDRKGVSKILSLKFEPEIIKEYA